MSIFLILLDLDFRKSYVMALAEFDAALGVLVSEDTFCGYCADFTPLVTYPALIGDSNIDFWAAIFNEIKIVTHHLKYIHRFFASSFFGRENSVNSMLKSEIFFFWCMENEKEVDFGYQLAVQFQYVLNSFRFRPLILGSFTTVIATNLGVFNESNINVGCRMLPLDINNL